MLRSSLPLLFVLASSCASSCASSSSSSSSDKASTTGGVTRREVLELLEAAEAAHHCAGEEATDAARRAELEACMTSSMKTARALLPRVTAEKAMQPGLLASIRLFVEEDLDTDDRQALCRQVPTSDDVNTMLDDEARAGCGVPSP